MQKKTRAFTVLELLVIVVVIFLLVGLLPVPENSRIVGRGDDGDELCHGVLCIL